MTKTPLVHMRLCCWPADSLTHRSRQRCDGVYSTKAAALLLHAFSFVPAIILVYPGQNNRPYLVMFCLLLHYTLYWCMAAFFNPEDEVSIGLHEKVGPCDVYQDVHTAFGMVSEARRL